MDGQVVQQALFAHPNLSLWMSNAWLGVAAGELARLRGVGERQARCVAWSKRMVVLDQHQV